MNHEYYGRKASMLRGVTERATMNYQANFQKNLDTACTRSWASRNGSSSCNRRRKTRFSMYTRCIQEAGRYTRAHVAPISDCSSSVSWLGGKLFPLCGMIPACLFRCVWRSKIQDNPPCRRWRSRRDGAWMFEIHAVKPSRVCRYHADRTLDDNIKNGT